MRDDALRGRRLVRRRAQIEEREKEQAGTEQAHAKNAALLKNLAQPRPLLVFNFPVPGHGKSIRSAYPGVERSGS